MRVCVYIYIIYIYIKRERQSEGVLLHAILYSAGEKKDSKFNLINFANSISKNSKTQVIIVKTELELIKYFKRNLTSNEIIIGMGAGSISKWMIGLKSSL